MKWVAAALAILITLAIISFMTAVPQERGPIKAGVYNGR